MSEESITIELNAHEAARVSQLANQVPAGCAHGIHFADFLNALGDKFSFLSEGPDEIQDFLEGDEADKKVKVKATRVQVAAIGHTIFSALKGGGLAGNYRQYLKLGVSFKIEDWLRGELFKHDQAGTELIPLDGEEIPEPKPASKKKAARKRKST